MALPFLKAETEEDATQTLAFVGIAIMTVGLTIMNVTGAIAGSEGVTGGRWLIRGALAVILSGAELLAAVALVRVMLAPNLWRKIVGSIIFIGLAWACIQNGKRAVHLIYPEFAESAVLLEAKAGIAANDANQLAEAKQAAIDATPAELEKVRTRIAELEAEQRLMASQSPEKIKEAQALLIAQGKYFGQVDGIRKELTEAAMRARGEEIRQEMDVLKSREANLSGGIVNVAPVLREAGQTADSAALKQVELEEMARKAKQATIWLEVMLWVFEGARSFGLWALVARITNENSQAAQAKKRSDAASKGWETRKANEENKPKENIPVRDDGYWTERIKKALKTKMKNPTAEGMWNTYFPGLASVHELRGKLNVRVKRGQLSQRDFDFIMREGEFAPPPPKEYPVARQDEPEIEPDNEDDADAPPVAAE
ncbi:MAG: hypothetical protein EP341_03025 [Sphingomonadales bacterium]|nr:MAG: hypothetical protein EP341_03025 [Sphingomonadales bacterium]